MGCGEEHEEKRHKEHKHKECKEHEDKEHKEHKEKECKEHEEHKEYKKCKEHEEHGKKYDEKDKGRKKMEYGEDKGEGYKLDGFHMKKRDLWLVAGGALGALAALGLGRISGKVRPAAVGAVREGYAFKEWLAGRAEKVKEDMEDIYAEGVHQYHSGLSATSESVKREKDILAKIERMVEEKLAKMKPEQQGGGE